MDSYDKDWDSYARTIDARKDAPDWQVLREARQTHWDTFFNIQQGDTVLDAGCGHGDYTVFVAKNRSNVWAFDYSNEMVQCTKTRIENLGLKAEKITQASVLEIPYPDAMFDTVLCLAVLDHLSDEDRKVALGELYRVLKPGGKLYLDVPNRLAFHWRLAFTIMRLLKLYPGGKIHFFTPWEIKSLVKSTGLIPLRSMGLTFCPPFSGIYTTDIRRITFFPEFLIKVLDTVYLFIEKNMREISIFKPLCWHYFLVSEKKINNEVG